MRKKNSGFSLLEIITVLAIVSILSAIIFAGVSTHKKAVLIAKTRIQFLQYESALKMYCREYGDLPDFFGEERAISLAEKDNSEKFIKVLSGKDVSGANMGKSEQKELNPVGKTFHLFDDDEFFERKDGTRDRSTLADAFNNKNIFIITEDPFDDDIVVPKEKFPQNVQRHIKDDGIKSSIVIFSVSDDGEMVISNCFEQKF